MIKKEINGKEYYFNPLSFQAIDELEKALGYGLYKFISNSSNFSLKEIETSLYAFARAGGNPITRDTLQTVVNEEGINALSDIVNESIIQILKGQPKASTSTVKKKNLKAAS